MRRTALCTIAVAFLCAFQTAPAQAAVPTRVFVAAQGLDSNPCTFALPCRTFQHAHNIVAANGEIDVLDPAGYGPVNITKAISIQGHGFSGISVGGGGTGIAINAAATDRVSLNGLLIEGSGVGNIGIEFISGRALVVENCVVRNVAQSGLQFGSNASTLQTLSVSNSSFTANGTNGILIVTLSTGAVTASIDRVVFDGNLFAGLNLLGQGGTGSLTVAVTDSTASNNINGAAGTGFLTQSTGGASFSLLLLTRCTAVGNAVGVSAFGANAFLMLAQSSLVGNAAGYVASGAGGSGVESYGDNYMEGNGASVGVLVPGTKQ
jgi:hypothetical protein